MTTPTSGQDGRTPDAADQAAASDAAADAGRDGQEQARRGPAATAITRADVAPPPEAGRVVLAPRQ